MKAKKGSARTRKFATGGDIAAGLVGLGTLGYLMSKKKDKEKEDAGNMSSIGEKSDVADKILSRSASSAAESAEDRQKKANMGEPEESDVQKAVGKPPASTTPAEPTKTATATETAKPVKIMKPKTAESKPAAPKPAPKSVANEERKSKPYPEGAAAKAKVGTGYEAVTKSLKDAEAKKAEKPAEKKPAEKKPADKTSREQNKQRLGANYAAQKRALDTAPEGPGKEALKKSVEKARRDYESSPMKRGGVVKSSASKRGDGIAQRGKTKGRIY